MALKCIILDYTPDREKRHGDVEDAVRAYMKEDVRIEYSPKGKPYIVGSREDMHISVTTTGSKVLVALYENPIGIDGEYIPRYDGWKTDYAALAERFFSAEEAEYIRGEDPDSEKEKFLKIWVRKEAYVKCVGKTIAEFPHFSVVEGEKILSRIGNVSVRKFNIRFDGCEDYLFAIAGV
ncbi:MAG: 4'-phosphopantetheinyl transferase superfamily protein [Clostridia bacterium]|nr:4'-phosphopantetheinyl transferase superfamily protein [Clostridia bacterium]